MKFPRMLVAFVVALLLAWLGVGRWQELSRAQRAERYPSGTPVRTVLTELGEPPLDRRVAPGEPTLCHEGDARELHFYVYGLITRRFDYGVVLCFDRAEQLVTTALLYD